MGKNFMLFSRNFFRRETTARAIKVAIIVALILIAINQYEQILYVRFNTTFFFKSMLTFFVPYFVSAFSSAKAYSEPRALNK
ncbi:MAG TPA: nitrate/nitrite transporter NrtS [Thermodesulfobacteriota bacterium]|nr:nitrate/nitrite transporter NrtS [Thermodesulfobacteriota bacterium]